MPHQCRLAQPEREVQEHGSSHLEVPIGRGVQAERELRRDTRHCRATRHHRGREKAAEVHYLPAQVHSVASAAAADQRRHGALLRCPALYLHHSLSNKLTKKRNDLVNLFLTKN